MVILRTLCLEVDDFHQGMGLCLVLEDRQLYRDREERCNS